MTTTTTTSTALASAIPSARLFLAAAVRSAESVLGGRMDEECVLSESPTPGAAVDVLVAVVDALRRFQAAASVLAAGSGPIADGERTALKAAIDKCEFLCVHWFPRPGAPPVHADAAVSAATAALRAAAKLIERVLACGNVVDIDGVSHACDKVMIVAAYVARSTVSELLEELAAAVTDYIDTRFRSAGRTTPATPATAFADSEAVLELVREVAKAMVISRTSHADGGWAPSPPANVTERYARWRAAAFVGTVDGLLALVEQNHNAVVIGSYAWRLAADFSYLTTVCCGCGNALYVLTVLAACSSGLALVGASSGFAACTVRMATVVLAGCTADRFCWGAFGMDTVDFCAHPPTSATVRGGGRRGHREAAVDAVVIPLQARVSGDTDDEEDEGDAELEDLLASNDGAPWAHPLHREAGGRWMTLVLAVAKRAIELVTEVLNVTPTPPTPQTDLDCVLLAAHVAVRGMEASAEFADRLRCNCVSDHLLFRRERFLKSAVGRLTAAAVARLVAATEGQDEEKDNDDGGGAADDDRVWERWKTALRARYFAFGTDAKQRLDAHCADSGGDAADASPAEAEGDPRIGYWSEMRTTVLRSWLTGEHAAGELMAAVRRPCWMCFVAVCMPATRAVCAEVANQANHAAGVYVLPGCGVDESDAVTLATLLAASSCASMRRHRGGGAEFLSEIQAAWTRRVDAEDLRAHLGTETGTPLARGVAAAVSLNCATWAAIVTRDAVTKYMRLAGGGQVAPEEEGDEDYEDDGDASPQTFWNWKPSLQSDHRAPVTVAVDCAVQVFDDSNGCELQHLFAAALLGRSAVTSAAVARWLCNIKWTGSLGAYHDGVACAGPIGARAIAKAREQNHLVVAAADATVWMLSECGWSGIADAAGVDTQTAYTLWTEMRNATEAERAREQHATRAAAAAAAAAGGGGGGEAGPAADQARVGLLSSLVGAVVSLYSSTRRRMDETESDVLMSMSSALGGGAGDGCDVESGTRMATVANPVCSSRHGATVIRAVEMLVGAACSRVTRRRVRTDLFVPYSPDAVREFCHLVRDAGFPAIAWEASDGGSGGLSASHATHGPAVLAMAFVLMQQRTGQAGLTSEDVNGLAEIILESARRHNGSAAHLAAVRTVVVTGLCHLPNAALPRSCAEDDTDVPSVLESMGLCYLHCSDNRSSLLPVPFVSDAEARSFIGAAERLLSGVTLEMVDVAVMCTCLAETLKRLLDVKTADTVFATIRAQYIRAEDATLYVRAALVTCVMMSGAVRLCVHALAAATSDRGGSCTELAERVTELDTVVRDAVDLITPNSRAIDERHPEISRQLAQAATVVCTAVGTTNEVAIYLLHLRLQASSTPMRRKVEIAPRDVVDSSKLEASPEQLVLSALRTAGPALEALASLPLVGPRLTPELASEAAISACRMWFDAALTPTPFVVHMRLRRELRIRYKIDKQTRDALCDLALAMMSNDLVADSSPTANRYTTIKAGLRELRARL